MFSAMVPAVPSVGHRGFHPVPLSFSESVFSVLHEVSAASAICTSASLTLWFLSTHLQSPSEIFSASG